MIEVIWPRSVAMSIFIMPSFMNIVIVCGSSFLLLVTFIVTLPSKVAAGSAQARTSAQTRAIRGSGFMVESLSDCPSPGAMKEGQDRELQACLPRRQLRRRAQARAPRPADALAPAKGEGLPLSRHPRRPGALRPIAWPPRETAGSASRSGRGASARLWDRTDAPAAGRQLPRPGADLRPEPGKPRVRAAVLSGLAPPRAPSSPGPRTALNSGRRRSRNARRCATTWRARGGATIRRGDGLGAIKACLPPRERRALVLVDPPYEAADEGRAVAEALEEGLRRMPDAVFALWYPLTSRARPESASDWIERGKTPALAVELVVDPDAPRMTRLRPGDPQSPLDVRRAGPLDRDLPRSRASAGAPRPRARSAGSFPNREGRRE